MSSLPRRAEHEEEKRPAVSADEPRMNTNRQEDRWASFAPTASGDEPHPGARASRPHNSWHSLVHLLHLAQPAAAPGLCFGRAHAVPAGGVAGCRIAGKLGGTERERMRAGHPRSRVGRFPSLLLLKGARPGLPGRSPCRRGRAVTLGGPSGAFQSLRGSLFFRLFLTSSSRPAGRFSRCRQPL